MKPRARTPSAIDAIRRPVMPHEKAPAIQPHGAGRHTCRTTACAANTRTQSSRPSPAGRNVNPVRSAGQPPAANALQQRAPVRPPQFGSRSPNYNVHTPVPVAGGSQQIKATIPGTPQVAGSVELSKAGAGRVYISNLKVDQQHRRRGVAAKLIDAALSAARRQGFKAASLEARPSDNGISPQALVAMYRRQGFKSVGKSQRGSPLMERKL